MQLGALLRLGFPSAPYLKYLTSLHTVTRWLVLQKARHHTHKVLWPVVGARFQDLFHSPSGVLFTFPSRYCFTIGHGRVCSLGGWSPQIPTGFLVSRRTQVPEPRSRVVFRLQDSHLVSWSVPAHFDYTPLIPRDKPR